MDENTESKIYQRMCRLIGEHINRVREEKHISLRKLSKDTSISIAVLSDLENGKKLPRFETLIKLLVTLNIPLDVLFNQRFLPEQTLDSKNTQLKGSAARKALLDSGFSKNEVKEIDNYIEFVKSKRDKKK